MKTRKQRISSRAVLDCTQSPLRGSTDTSCSESEHMFSKRRQLRPRRTPSNRIKVDSSSDTYDADSEPSSANESSCSTRRVDTDKPSDIDEYIFSDDEPTSGISKSAQSKSDAKGRVTPSTPGMSDFKVPNIINLPTPRLSSNLKKVDLSSPALLRVSFSDESFSDADRYSNRPLRGTPIPSKRMWDTTKASVIETSTPASSHPLYLTDMKLRMTPKIALPRLSDIASPIANAGDGMFSLKRRRSSPRSGATSQTSGYESMIRSSVPVSPTDTVQEGPPTKRMKKPLQSTTNENLPQQDRPVNSMKYIKLQRKLAMLKLKEREDKYLAEMEDLEDFDLCIESKSN